MSTDAGQPTPDEQPQADTEPGSSDAAEAPLADGYGNDTGFAEEAEEADGATS